MSYKGGIRQGVVSEWMILYSRTELQVTLILKEVRSSLQLKKLKNERKKQLSYKIKGCIYYFARSNADLAVSFPDLQLEREPSLVPRPRAPPGERVGSSLRTRLREASELALTYPTCRSQRLTPPPPQLLKSFLRPCYDKRTCLLPVSEAEVPLPAVVL